MLVQSLPDTMTKLAQLGDATIYEPAGDRPQQERVPGASDRSYRQKVGGSGFREPSGGDSLRL